MTSTNTKLENNTGNKKSEIRMVLENIESEIYKSWLRDLDKTSELRELNENILKKILLCESIEDYFENNQSDFDYFIKKFSKDTINNILRQQYIFGDQGDMLALTVLISYLKILTKFMNKNQYFPLWDSIKDIFDYNKPFYKGTGYVAVSNKVDPVARSKKLMSPDEYNVIIYLKFFFNYFNISYYIFLYKEYI